MIYLEKLEEAKKKKRGRCWTGYKPKPGSVPYSPGSCVKEAYKLGIGLALIEAEEKPKKPKRAMDIPVTNGASAKEFLRTRREEYGRAVRDFYKKEPKDKS